MSRIIKLSPIKKRILFLLLMVIGGSIFTLIYLAAMGNTNQVYNDIIVEWTSIYSSNKSAERNLPFLLIFMGIVVYGLFYLITKRIWKDWDFIPINYKSNEVLKTKEFLCALASITGLYFLIFNGTHQIVIASLIYVIILFLINKELIYTGICTYYLGIYASFGLYRLYVVSGGQNNTNNMIVATTAFLVSLIPLGVENKRKALLHLGMIEGIIIPFSLLIYLANRYKNGEEITIIDVPENVKIVLSIIIIAFVIEAFWVIIKKWKKAENIDEIILLGTCISVMAYNRFSGTGAIMPADMHHPFENIIGYSQIFSLGQNLFTEYIPISGMYSIVQGTVFDWFGNAGTLSNYYVTENLFYLFVLILIGIIVRKHVTGTYALLISLIYNLLSYNRSAFMLPVMLLLALPELIEKNRLWLQIWFLTSLFHGLYYPLYGVAVCLAFAPLGLWQAINYIESGQLKKDSNKITFWITWGICLLCFILNSHFLLGTLKHMLAMTGQSLLADGLSRFGQLIPGWFLPYLDETHTIVRIGLYYIITVMVPVIFVWAGFAMAIRVADISFDKGKIRIRNLKKFCLMASAVIMPIVCYTFTFTRLDVDSIYARSAGVLYAGMVILLIFVWNYINKEGLRLLLIITLIAIPGISNEVGVFSTESNSKLMAYYTVPEGYMYVENDEVEKLGTGYIEQNVYTTIKETYARFADKSRDASYIGDPALFGYFYLLGIKGDGPIELALTVKGYDATTETVDIIRKNNSIIAPSFTPFFNYYLYHWLLASGEYYWNADTREFYPNNGLYTRAEIIDQNKNILIAWDGMDVGKTSSSWGLSMKSLERIFTEYIISYKMQRSGSGVMIELSEPIDGDSADFVYIEFAGMDQNYVSTLFDLNSEVIQEDSYLAKNLMKKKYNDGMVVQLRWHDDNGELHLMNCAMSEGKLLIPIGAGLKWLFNQHNFISVYTYQNGDEIVTPEISNIRFLKVREIN